MAFNIGETQPHDAWIFELTSKPQAVAQFLYRHRIVSPPICPTPFCNTLCVPSPITNQRELSRHRLPYKWVCPQVGCNGQHSFLFGSYLYNTKLSIQQHIGMLYKFYLGRNAKQSAQELNMQHRTVIVWFDYFRRNLNHWMQNHFYPNFQFSNQFAIQWDEASFAKKQRYHRGHRREPNWVVGGVQQETGLVALKFVQGRERDTLLPLITALCEFGATQITDGWRGYLGLDLLGFTHWNVNHSEGFVDPLTGHHTNTIEGIWSLARGDLRRFRGIQRPKLQSFLDEFAFRRNMRLSDDGVWVKLLLTIGTTQHSIVGAY